MTPRADSKDPSDLVLLARIRSGDVEALEALLQEYWGSLKSYAARLLDSEDAADDLVQEAFIRLWEHRERWRLEGSVRALLYTITRNAALDRRKSMRRRQRVQAGFQDLQRAVPTPAEQAEGRELHDAVQAAVADLPPRRKEVFMLARHDGLSYGQIAEVMGISIQTVANHFSLALADLRRSLADFLDVEGCRGETSRAGDVGMQGPPRRVNGD
jgi:RNA polymerase sigma-70 factor (ECF subfamily)